MIEEKEVLENIAYIMLDADGCMLRPNKEIVDKIDALEMPDDEKIKRYIIETNLGFLNWLASVVQQSEYNEYYLALNTNRQTEAQDLSNNYGRYGKSKFGQCSDKFSATAILLVVKSFLEKKTGKKIIINPIMMTDIAAQHAPGTTFNNIVQKRYFGNHDIRHAGLLAMDHGKVTLALLHVHDIAVLKPKANIDVLFVDDKEIIHNVIYQFFNLLPQVFPSTIRLTSYQYDGDHLISYPPIRGKGPINPNYALVIIYLFLIATVNSSVLTKTLEEIMKEYNETKDFNVFQKYSRDATKEDKFEMIKKINLEKINLFQSYWTQYALGKREPMPSIEFHNSFNKDEYLEGEFLLFFIDDRRKQHFLSYIDAVLSKQPVPEVKRQLLESPMETLVQDKLAPQGFVVHPEQLELIAAATPLTVAAKSDLPPLITLPSVAPVVAPVPVTQISTKEEEIIPPPVSLSQIKPSGSGKILKVQTIGDILRKISAYGRARTDSWLSRRVRKIPLTTYKHTLAQAFESVVAKITLRYDNKLECELMLKILRAMRFLNLGIEELFEGKKVDVSITSDFRFKSAIQGTLIYVLLHWDAIMEKVSHKQEIYHAFKASETFKDWMGNYTKEIIEKVDNFFNSLIEKLGEFYHRSPEAQYGKKYSPFFSGELNRIISDSEELVQAVIHESEPSANTTLTKTHAI